jgi:hypothetical protein
MRYLLLALMCVGCAQPGGGSSSSAGACAGSPAVGSWDADTSTNVLTFTAQCAGSDVYCQSTFTWPNFTSSSGTVLVTVTSTNTNAGCLPAGTTTCAYQFSGNQLGYDCGGGILTYTKVP